MLYFLFLHFLIISFVFCNCFIFNVYLKKIKTILELTIVGLSKPNGRLPFCDNYSVALYNGNNGVHVKKLFW